MLVGWRFVDCGLRHRLRRKRRDEKVMASVLIRNSYIEEARSKVAVDHIIENDVGVPEHDMV